MSVGYSLIFLTCIIGYAELKVQNLEVTDEQNADESYTYSIRFSELLKVDDHKQRNRSTTTSR